MCQPCCPKSGKVPSIFEELHTPTRKMFSFFFTSRGVRTEKCDLDRLKLPMAYDSCTNTHLNKSKNTNPNHYNGEQQNIYIYSGVYIFKIVPLPIKTHPHSILQVPTTQLVKMSIDPKFVELTADVLKIFL